MKKKSLKEQKGFAASDALIAVLIIALFSGLIATISYNIYLANSSIKRMSKANGYIVDMFEYIDKTYYYDVTKENLTQYFNNKYYYEKDSTNPKTDAEAKIQEATEIVDTPFKVTLELVNYNQTEGNEDKFDLVKEITMTVEYKVGNKNQIIKMKTIKSRETLETPNRPDLDILELIEGEKIYPIKNTDSGWRICDQKDNSWYNYESGNWAIILKTTRDLSIDDQIDVNNLSENESTYAWIPRYAYDGTNNKIVFLFSNSNKFVQNIEEHNNLKQIDENLYIVPQDFTVGEEAIQGIWTNDTTLQAYQKLDLVYPLNT